MNSKSLLLSFMVLGIASACGKGQESQSVPPQPEETVESMLTLVPSESGECPEISGTYSCPSEETDGADKTADETEESSILITKRQVGHHGKIVTGQSPDFFTYIVTKYFLDDNGLIIDGQIKDKTEKTRDSLTILMNAISSPLLRAAQERAGFIFYDELQKLDIPKLNAGYTASCRDGKVRGHYVLGSTAAKVTMSSLPNGDLSIVTFSLDEQGQVKKDGGVCKLVSKDVKPEADFASDVKKSASGLLEKFNLSGKMKFQMANKTEWTLKEPIVLEFDRESFRSDNYVFKKAYFGNIDDIWFDDVDVEHPYSEISVNATTMTVTAKHKDGRTEVIADIRKNGENFIIHFNVAHEVNRTLLTLR